jgi:stage III sporulation protein AG
MEILDKVKNYLMRRGRKKNMDDLMIVFIVGVIIILAANFFLTPVRKSPGLITADTENVQTKSVALTYEEKLAQELTNVLGHIKGAGKVEVMISFESGSEVVPAFSSNNSTKVTEENDGSGGKRDINENTVSTNIVTTNEAGATKPFITKEIKPKISGVIVIAEGAGSPDVKYELYEAVKTVFNISQLKVKVLPMEKNK